MPDKPAQSLARANVAAPIPFYVVFDGMPGPQSCHFVETETEDGRGVGPSVAGKWSNHPRCSNQARLGPFVRATPLVLAAPQLLEALRKCLSELTTYRKDASHLEISAEVKAQVAIRAAGSKPL